MTVRSRGDELPTSARHPLLELRQGEPEASVPPEPTWVLEREPETSLVVWESPDSDGPVLTIEGYDGPAWELVLELWKRYRDFSGLEQALMVAELSEELTDGQRRTLADHLGLPASEPLFAALNNISDYPEAFRDKLQEGDVSLRVIRYLDLVPERIRTVLVEGLRTGTIKLSVQEIRQLEEAVRRLTDDRIEDWVETVNDRDPEENPRAEGQALLSLTRDMAYPRTRKRREEFEAALESLDLDGRITVTPPKNFEGDYLDFKFRCRRNEDLIRLAEELKRCKQLLKHL